MGRPLSLVDDANLKMETSEILIIINRRRTMAFPNPHPFPNPIPADFDLQDIKAAFKAYLATKVGLTISSFTADVPDAISPSEGFSFNVEAKNAPSFLGGIGLANVRYHLTVDNPGVVQLEVPPVTIAKATSAHNGNVALTPGTFVPEMVLSPSDNSLSAGDTDTLSGLRGKAVSLGQANVKFHILADPDLNDIFAKNEESKEISGTVQVV
jgi:hypothetical protein